MVRAWKRLVAAEISKATPMAHEELLYVNLFISAQCLNWQNNEVPIWNFYYHPDHDKTLKATVSATTTISLVS